MLFFIILFHFVASEPLNRIDLPRSVELVQNQTRRILRGKEVGDTRPYMVYLRPASTSTAQVEQEWICGGAIIDERYIITSAACIEEVNHFYVISGTHKWVSANNTENECIKNGQKKAVWKCVPKSYVFDGEDFDNIKWMINDIAIVKVEDDFNFNKRIKGCDYVPMKIAYNNQSVDLEKPKTLGSIAGWGSTGLFSDVVAPTKQLRTAKNSETLLETEVLILSKKNCKKRWEERYHDIIEQYMICGKDSSDGEAMNMACDSEVNCKELVYSEETEDEVRRILRVPDPAEGTAQNGQMQAQRRSKAIIGGFCENDHGGPLVFGHGKTAMVIGVISASQVRERTNHCYGPFLYTSVWNNRHLISCAIDKEMGATCRKLLRTANTQMSETFFKWKSHPDGPSKEEIVESQNNTTPATPTKANTTVSKPRPGRATSKPRPARATNKPGPARATTKPRPARATSKPHPTRPTSKAVVKKKKT